MPANADLSPLLGAWHLQSLGFTYTDTGERVEPFGPNPEVAWSSNLAAA